MFRFLKALPKTTLLYRGNPAARRAELAALLLAGAALLAACRHPLGFPGLTDLILTVLGQGVLMISGLVFLVRGGGNAVEDSMKLSRLLLVTWTVTLILFVHNFFSATRVLYDLREFELALVYAGVATLLMFVHTINQERSGTEPGSTRPWMAIILGWVLLTAVMAIWLYLFVINERSSEQIEEFLSFQNDSRPCLLERTLTSDIG